MIELLVGVTMLVGVIYCIGRSIYDYKTNDCDGNGNEYREDFYWMAIGDEYGRRNDYTDNDNSSGYCNDIDNLDF